MVSLDCVWIAPDHATLLPARLCTSGLISPLVPFHPSWRPLNLLEGTHYPGLDANLCEIRLAGGVKGVGRFAFQ